MLCDKFELPEESVVGMAMILGPAEGETIPESAEVQKAALQVSDIKSRLLILDICVSKSSKSDYILCQVLCVLLCGPVVRPGCPKNSTTPTPKTKLARSGVRSSDEVINKVRNIVNGVEILTL